MYEGQVKNLLTPTEEQIEFFKERTGNHIKRVYNNMCIFAKIFTEDADEIIQRGADHDKSKYSDAEFIPYVFIDDYYKQKSTNPNHEYHPVIKKEVEKAWAHHLDNNRHHPQHHKDCNDMTLIDLCEMIADWQSMSQELNQDGGSCKGWAKKVIPSKHKFNEEKQKVIFELIAMLDHHTMVD